MCIIPTDLDDKLNDKYFRHSVYVLTYNQSHINPVNWNNMQCNVLLANFIILMYLILL